MTPRSFWTILVKLLGFYIVVQSLIAIPSFLSSLAIFYKQEQAGSDGSYLVFIAGYFVMLIAIYLTILRLCLFKTDVVIDKLQLDQGYRDERFEFNIHRSTILKIVVIIMGGLLVIDSVPLLLQQVLSYLQQSHAIMYNKFTDGPTAKYITLYFIKTSIGVFMLTSSRLIVNFIELKQKRTVTDAD